MKGLVITAVAVAAMAAGAAVAVHVAASSNDPIFEANVEALTDGEGDTDGALWSDPSGTVYCCGPGNVRDCDDTFVPHC